MAKKQKVMPKKAKAKAKVAKAKPKDLRSDREAQFRAADYRGDLLKGKAWTPGEGHPNRYPVNRLLTKGIAADGETRLVDLAKAAGSARELARCRIAQGRLSDTAILAEMVARFGRKGKLLNRRGNAVELADVDAWRNLINVGRDSMIGFPATRLVAVGMKVKETLAEVASKPMPKKKKAA